MIMSQTWVLIPGFNEEKYLEQVLKKVKKYTNQIVFVDDGSKDQTVSIAKKQLTHVLVHQVNLGKGAALKTGCEYIFNQLKADNVVLMDADDQHNPAELPLFFQALKQHDIVLGVRDLTSTMPGPRVWMNKLTSYFVKLLFGVYIPDIPSGYKAFSKKTYTKIKWDTTEYGVELEIAAKIAQYRLAFKVINIETIYQDFDRGMTAIDSLKLINYLISLRIKL